MTWWATASCSSRTRLVLTLEF